VVRVCRRVRKAQCRLLDHSVRLGQAAGVLAQMLFPGRDTEDFYELVRPLSVAVQLPARPARLESRPAELPHRLQEVRLPFRIDGVVDAMRTGPVLGSGSKAIRASVQ
jgi:hypothetical protein